MIERNVGRSKFSAWLLSIQRIMYESKTCSIIADSRISVKSSAYHWSIQFLIHCLTSKINRYKRFILHFIQKRSKKKNGDPLNLFVPVSFTFVDKSFCLPLLAVFRLIFPPQRRIFVPIMWEKSVNMPTIFSLSYVIYGSWIFSILLTQYGTNSVSYLFLVDYYTSSW